MTSLTIQQIRDAQAAFVKAGGGDDSSLQAKYYARPVSYYIAWLLIRFGVTANQTTAAALLACVAGCMLVLTGHPALIVLGAVLLNVGHLLDYTDGTLAKATGTVSKLGMYLDKTCDEIVETAIPLAVGVALINTDTIFPVLGAVCAILHLWSALASAHSKEVYGKSTLRKLSGVLRYPILVGVNLKALTVPSLLVAAFVPNGLAVFLIGLTILTTCEFAVSFYTGVRE